MAARRVSKTAVEWAAFSERIAPSKKESFRKFKALNDKFLGGVHQYPEQMPKIDFDHYKSRLVNKAMVAEFEKTYAGVNVPYPKDPEGWMSKIEGVEKSAAEALKTEIVNVEESLALVKAYRKAMDTLPSWEELTKDMQAVYFPKTVIDMEKNPKMWPYTKSVDVDAPGSRVLNYAGKGPHPLSGKPAAF